MAKKQLSEPLEAVAESADGTITPVAQILPLWKISPKNGSAGEELVEAATIEDAIRVYNGNSGAFAFKQLNIEAV